MMNRSQYEDLKLLKEIKAGNVQAFNTLFNKYSSFLKIEAYYQLKDTELSEEVVNDVFHAIWTIRTDLTIKGCFKYYLFKAVRNKCYDRRKSMQSYKNIMHQAKDIDADYGFYPEINLENKELGQQISDAIDQIKNLKGKMAFELQFIHNKPQKEIAELMGIKLHNVKKMVSRALETVRTILNKHQ